MFTKLLSARFTVTTMQSLCYLDQPQLCLGTLNNPSVTMGDHGGPPHTPKTARTKPQTNRFSFAHLQHDQCAFVSQYSVAQRHQMASSSLALLLFIGLDLLGSRAAALIGDKVLWNGEIFPMYVHLSVHSPLWAIQPGLRPGWLSEPQAWLTV